MNKILLAAMLLMGGTAAAQHVTVGGNVFGGGNKASVARGTKVVIDQAGAVITGSVYGGGALAKVDTAISALNPSPIAADPTKDSTLVTILRGNVQGNVYGGGLGDKTGAPYNGTANVEAHVYGGVHVSIGKMLKKVNEPLVDSLVGNATIGGSVFGCNNLNGSPQKNVLVDIWQTAHTTANTYPIDIDELEELRDASVGNTPEYADTFAIAAVYGGGNMAHYTASGDTATVHIHTCLNTIRTVYGGGNAADATNVQLIVDGGRFDQVFGGGNGYSAANPPNHDNPSGADYNPGANVSESATTEIHGGLYRQLFGGSNQYGNVANASLSIDHTSSCTELILESFGGANEAQIGEPGHPANVTTNLLCSDIEIGSFYGGSNKASIIGNVTLNVYGGTYINVFGGSKGVKQVGISGNPGYVAPVAANITGDVTLNLFGGHMTNAFGGSDANGNITGSITVNMLDFGLTDCGLQVHNIYGGGNLTAYDPTDPTTDSITVNLIHGTVSKSGGNYGNVFGGGYGTSAEADASTVVNIGYDTTLMGATNDNTKLLYRLLHNPNPSITYAPAVNDTSNYAVTVGGNVYGGGALAAVDGNTTVVVRNANTTVSEDVYGGGALADVGTDNNNHITVIIADGAVNGDVYGGGLGRNAADAIGTEGSPGYVPAVSAVPALVKGIVQVTIDGGTVNDVFGCNNINGRPTDSVRVDINSNVGGNVFGGGNLATYTGNPYVYINNGTVSGNVFGGGNGDPADNTQTKGSVTGIPHVIVGDTLTAHSAYQAIVSGDVYGGGNAAKVVTGTPVVTVLPKCNTEITSVYGGGNAADVPATSVTIHGGTIDSVYGGGHGDKDVNPAIAANVTGNTSVTITGGTIGQVFGGSNENGTISGAIGVNVNKGNNSCPMVISAVYGGGNFAASNACTINIGCTGASSSEYIDTVFGGANRANVTGDIELNITGGRINNTFGGNNNSGAIDGDITVNVEWATPACGDNHLGNVYGAGNLASYSQKTAGHPVVNIKNGTAANVFGGGKGLSAVVTGNPVVTIGDANGSHVANVTGRVYGGGDAAAVTGNTTVTYNDNNASSVVDSIFGGGNAAGVSGTAIVTLTSGKVTGGLYGGCNTTGIVGGNITVNLNGGTVGVSGLTTDVVYGGGFGHSTETGGDVNVTLNGTTVYGNLYGGSALGSVNASNKTTTVTIDGSGLNGTVFGGGMGEGTGSSTQATTLGDVVINYNTANSGLTGIYGGANVNGDVTGDIAVNIEANVGASDAGNSRDIFGGGLGQYTTTAGDVTVTIGNSSTPEIYGNIYGGSALGQVGAAGKFATIDFKDGTLHDTIFGGGKGNSSIAAAVNGGTNVTVTTGTIGGGIYGGANIKGTVAENITVDVNGGTIGANGSPANVFGGGFGNNTSTSGNVTVTIDGAGATVWGDVYGGSGFGNVGNDINDAVVVNILNGEVKGSVFGGGLGSTSPAYAATEAGTVTVNIGSGTPVSVQGGASSVTGGATILGSVYGCNNTNGSPNGDVTVNIFKTAHTSGTNTTADAGFAITKVFGGGKNANYSAPGKKATVNVYTCDNTIGTLFGGGDAAAVPATEVNIYGGRLGTVFGGGNGEVTAANVNGNINLNMHGGTIGTLVSASNQRGTISGTINVNVDNVNGCTETVTDFFGGANQVDITSNVNATIECGAGTFTNVYGGSNKANIGGSVTFTIKGGTITNAFGGSKGVLVNNNPDDPSSIKANITGNVTLNLYGGTITNAFGGSDQNGTIGGTITVNVLDYETTNCGLEVTNVYGAGNLTAYTGSPTVNVMHGTVSGNVYGAGLGSTADVTGNPQVNIGYVDGMSSLVPSDHKYKSTTDNLTAVVTGSVFGGGDEAAVEGSPVVLMQKANSQAGNLYGGGNEAGIVGSTTITMNSGTVTDGIYGGCNTSGTVTGDATVTLLGGTVGSLIAHTASVPASVTGRIFGGGYGASTNVDGQVHVIFGNNAGTATPTLIGDLYGGSALGKVNTNSTHLGGTTVNGTDSVVVDILSGTIQGTVYGGGLGRKAKDLIVNPAEDTAILAIVHGRVHVNIGDSTHTKSLATGNDTIIYTGSADFNTYALTDSTTGGGSVYGCNNTNGSPQHNVYVDVYQCYRDENELVTDVGSTHYSLADVLGGGNEADYAPDNGDENSTKKPYVTVHGCANTINRVFGGGNAADAVGTYVVVEGGRFNEIFGGGNGAVRAANVTPKGAHLDVLSGRVGYVFGECNRRGTVTGGVNVHAEEGDHGNPCGPLIIDNHFFGGNFADVIGEKVYTMTCTDDKDKNYTGLYGGCRLGTVYGNVTLIIEGGNFINVYAGSLGANDYAANIRKYPTLAQLQADTALGVTDEAKERWNISPYIHEEWNKPENKAFRDSAGTGGNLTLILRGGTIDNAFGGCNQNGSAEGRITVIIDDAEDPECPLDVDYVYGGSNLARYRPDDPTITSPIVELRNGTVNYDVFGGGHGSADNVNAGLVTSNPMVVMGGDKKIDTAWLRTKHHVKWINDGDAHDFWVKGNIYGGGEMGSVGNFTRVDNAVTACAANTGKTTVDIRTGTVGPVSMPAEFLSGYTGDNFERDRIVGMVFGGSKGAVGDTTVKPFYSHIAYANQTEVIIGNSDHTGPFIKGSVYGGAQSGRVYRGGTYVKIQGGQIGCGADESDPYSAGQFIATPATVTSSNHLAECPHWVYGRDDGNGVEHLPFDLFATNSTADARPKGSDGHTFYGNVFGGGSGYFPYASGKWIRSAGQVFGRTKVEITGGHILTSIYGGNELTDVTGDSCVVIMSGGTLGVPRTPDEIAAHPVTCYLFGAGKGDERVHFNKWTNVQNTRVTVSGDAHIYGSIFGGGEDGHVMHNAKVVFDVDRNGVLGTTGTSYVDGNIFGGGRGFKGEAMTAGNVADRDTVIIRQGTILGSVYGGGRLGSVGYDLCNTNEECYGKISADANRGHIVVTITGGIIGNDVASDYGRDHSRGGNVYGGSMGRLTKLDGSYALALWHGLGSAKSTKVTISGDTTWIKGNVYGGSELGTVTEDIQVNISGNVTVGRKAASTTTSHGNVYGGGVGQRELTAAERTEVGNDATSDSIPTFAGLTGGTIQVNISGGAINNNVYGAGELASVGTIATVEKHTDKATTYFLSWPYKYTYTGTSGDARVNITGGTIGFINGSDTTGGNIYGSARGTVGDRYVTGRLATARVTHVDINLTNPGDKIIGDVYGSGENGHVYDSAVVTLTNGLVLGNVFGGGKGVDTYTDQLKDPTDNHLYNAEVYDIIAGKVFGNTKVNILGGRVAKNVYGGGNLASVGIGNYKGYGEATGTISSADSSLAENSGHCYVTILGGIIGPDSIINGTIYNGDYAVTTGHVYGAGKGIVFPTAPKVGFDYDRDYYVAYVNKTFVVIGDSNNRSCQYTNIDPHVTGIVFGGGENGHVRFDTYVQTNRGQIGVRPLDSISSDVGHWSKRGNIFGAGRGEDLNTDGSYCQSAGSVTRNTRIDVLGARIYRNVQGGGSMASVGPIKGRTGDSSTCVINVNLPSAGDTLGAGPENKHNAFGGYIGGGSRGIPSPDGTRNDSLATCHNSQINIYRGRIRNTIYGGGENGQMLGNTQINVYGGYIRATIYGGGKGCWKADADEAGMPGTYTNDTLSGYVKGNTEINLLGGTVPYTYGGCRRANVGGNATINIGRDNSGTYEGNVSFQSSKRKVYGGNQYAGTPKGNIYVNVYKTAHTATDSATFIGTPPAKPTYAIGHVYGGSYNSDYLPKDSGHFAQVHIYGCENTIGEVYGGCAAADAGAKPGIGASTKLIIDGGRFNKVFGGGDGTFDRYIGTPVPANIYGTAETEIHGGKIDTLFGGGNFMGQADTIRISVDNSSGCGNVEGDEFFSGSNVAELGTALDPITLLTTLGCGVQFNAAYGGSNQANITGDVTFTIKGGTIGKVFGGSKGLAAVEDDPNTNEDETVAGVPANITGNVTTNIYGGTLGYVYGGSNLNGNITGLITVNIDSVQTTCPLTIENNVYGGSYITAYEPTDTTDAKHYSPIVNIKHGTVGLWGGTVDATHGNVFGGGHGTGARTVSNPQVNMGNGVYTGTDSYDPTGTGSPSTNPAIAKKPVVKGSIYGGGHLARVFGSTDIAMADGTVKQSIYGGGKGATSHADSGHVRDYTVIGISGGQVTGNVYGGGEMGTVGLDATVNISGTALIGYDKGITIDGGDSLSYVYGGGKGKGDDPLVSYNTFADVRNTYVNVSGGQVSGSVFGGAEDGHVLGNTNVRLSGSNVIGSGGYEHELDGCVLGGGRNTYNHHRSAGRVQGHTYVTVTGGRIRRSVFGGGAMARVGVDANGLLQDNALYVDGKYDSTNHGSTFVNVSGTTDTVTGVRAVRYNYAGKPVADSLGFTAEDSLRYKNFFTTTYCIPGTNKIVVYKTAIGCHDDSTLVDNDYTIGDIFGGGKGDTKDTADIFAGRVMNTSVRVHGSPRIMADIYAGGEMSCIGWYDTTGANRDEYYDNTGYTSVNVSGSPYGGTPFEFSETNIHGGRAWTLIDSTGRLYHTCSGNIYGGGQGYVEQGATHCHNWVQMGRVRKTDVQVSGGRFLGNVFGGGSRGIVKEDCHVTITGGHFGTVITDKRNNKGDTMYYYGSIFGGGYGNPKTFWHYNDSCFVNGSDTLKMRPTEYAGRVYGDTRVDVSGGHIMGNVFGGGDLASTGWVERDADGKFQFDDSTKHHGGLCVVNISGTVVIGPLDGTEMNGEVYGAGKGVGHDRDEVYKTYCNVNGTQLTVSGGHIYGSTFGGGADCHVLGHTRTTIKDSADIGSGEPFNDGHGGYSQEYDGCVIGGGRNALNITHTAGRVQGNSYVTVTGGRIRRSVIGGGALARTGVDTAGVITPYIINDKYDSHHHGHTFIDVTGTTDTIDGTDHIGKDYYGNNQTVIGFSSEDSVKYARYLGTTDTMTVGGVKKVVVYLTAIGAPDDTIIVVNDYTIGDIFGGGKGDTKDTIDILAGKVMNTSVKVHGSPRIMADIYAGGEMSCIGWYDTEGADRGKYYDNTGYTRVVVSDSPYTGTPYEFSQHNIHAGRKWTLIDSIGRLYHTCSGNVYGGGQGYAEQDATHRHNWVQMGRVRKTDVTVNGGRFMGNIFGGGSRGFVMENCDVKVNGGTIGCVITDNLNPRDDSKRYYYGSVFGGGYGNHKVFPHKNDSCFVKGNGDTVLMMPIEMAGRVYGNTYVTVKGGHIMNCVFGGGDMASTGWVERNPANGDYYYDTPAKRHGGICTVSIEGGEIGPLDMTGHNAYVYGAGKGIPSDSTDKFKHCANVNETHLTVKGGKIWGSTFGGGADSHVLGDVHTKVTTGADLGTRGITSYDGNIFGAGRNFLNTNHTNGRVQGNIYILMDGGSIKGTIFGGGRLALSGVDSVGHFIDSLHGNVDILVCGNAVIGTSTAADLLAANQSCGDIFGSGKGDILNYEDVWSGRVTNTKITVKDSLGASPRIYGSVFGGGEMASLGYWDDTIKNGDDIIFYTTSDEGTNYSVIYENTGRAVINLSGNLTVGSALEYTVAPYKNPGNWTIYESTATDTTLIHTCTGNVFGGSQGDVDVSAPRWVSMGRSASSVVNISGGTYYGNVYGGSEQGIVTGDTRLNISGGTFGYTDQEGAIHGHLDKVYSGDIYAAGYGCDDESEWGDDDWQSTTEPENDSTAGSRALHLGWNPGLLAGRTFGNARVDITGGTIHGSVYGGGSFASVGDDKPGFTVNGNTTVNIGLPGPSAAKAAPDTVIGNATIDGEVFGANNFSGTPYGNTTVHIYKTAHDGTNNAPTANDTKALRDPADELTEADVEVLPTDAEYFALSAVYGGGNRAAHTPIASSSTTLVHVHYCEENTIKEVYGGGNAANTQNNHIIIEGGYIYEVFGGGNGAGEGNPGADVSGTAHTEILGGLITNVFGGSNSKGTIGNTILEIEPDGNCDIMVANTYGGSNEAEGGGGVINLLCGTKIGTFYGGSRKANLVGDITLNVYGGTYENIFGGSQGTLSEPANIEGNVTLNFYGGNVQRLFGGSDVNGNITGTVLVNVDIDPYYKCDDGLRLDTVYGGGHDAAYTPFDPFRASPTVNIMNNRYYTFNGTPGTLTDSAYVRIIDVFGGGLGATATVTSYPRVVIGGFPNGSKVFNEGSAEETTVNYTRDVHIYGNAYGGGSMAPTNGNTIVYVRDAVIGETEESFTSGNLFGGGYGTTSKVNGDTYVGVFGLSDIKSNVYGGGNAGIVTGNTEIVVGFLEQILPPELIAYLDETDPSLVRAGFHSPTPNVHFRYTTDGSIPTTSTGNLYADDILSPSHNKVNDFLIDWNQPIQMIGYLWDGSADETSGKIDSSMIPSIVGFDKSTMPIITFKDGTAHVGDPDSANFNGSVGSKIYYTLNGDEPTSSSTLWGTVREAEGSAFAIGANDVVKAIAVQRGCFNSEVAYLTADPPTVEHSSNTFTITAKPGERIIYTLGTIDVPTPISLMNHGQRPGQGPGETGMVESTDTEYSYTTTASAGSTVTHMKRVYTNSKGETVTYRWSEVTAASSGPTTVSITVGSTEDHTVKAIVERAGHAPSPIAADVYRH